MKKILGISLVAVLAATPLMARADTAPSAYAINAQNSGQDLDESEAGTTPVAADGKYFKGKSVSAEDASIVATGAYVKGAYNAAISAVNALGEELDTAISNVTLKEGNGIDIDANNKINVDYEADKGLAWTTAVDGHSQLTIKDGAGIKTGSNGIEVDLTDKGGLNTDGSGKLQVVTANSLTKDNSTGAIGVNVDGTTITIDSTTGALKAELGDYATKAGVVATVESGSVAAIKDVSVAGVTAYTNWADETNGRATLGNGITVTRGRENVVITQTASGGYARGEKYHATTSEHPDVLTGTETATDAITTPYVDQNGATQTLNPAPAEQGGSQG